MSDTLNLVIFGITSNLSQIKLIPALYDLANADKLPEKINIIGVARAPKSTEEIKQFFSDTLEQENRHHLHPIKPEVLVQLLSRVTYLDGHLDDPLFYPKLEEYLLKMNPDENFNTIFYLATYPSLYSVIFSNLQTQKLNQETHGWVRLMIEKPIGSDLESAQKLNTLLNTFFKESQIYRLDHYLGKETLQNILTFRFGNSVFEQLINKDNVDHIQISALEDFGIGKRGDYYDSVGALKDVGQNHLLQMITLATMEKPLTFNNEEITKERTKVLEALLPDSTKVVFGQYSGYTKEEHVDFSSKTDTFFAFKTEIKNDRFKGVPIYVRGGKKLNQTVTEISIVFKEAKDTPFTDIHTGIKPNVLIYRIQPNEGIVLKIMTKKSGYTQELEETYMQFCFRDYETTLPDPYEKLIADAINGDQTYFNAAKEVEAEWKFIDPLYKTKTVPFSYESGTYGPKEANQLIEDDGRKWLDPSMMFCKI